MHSMWKGAISFGLVMIPVRLYAATEQKDISFRQVHRADGGRIKFRRFCSVCGEEVPYEDVAKGYELPTGEMVILGDEDMAELPLPTTRSIEVLHFAPVDQLDPILFNRSYFVEPETAGARAYVLLRDALEQSGRVAVAQVALRQRESLATLRSRDGVLLLETLLWPDEIRPPLFPFLDQDIEVRPQELQMAASLIDSMTSDFDPDAHKDGYREALAELVDAKVQGRELLQPGTLEIAASPATSLADALQASLAAAREAPATGQSGQQAKAVGAKSTSPNAIESGPAKRAGSSRSRKPAADPEAAADSGSAADSAADPESAAPASARARSAKPGPAKGGSPRSGSPRSGSSKASPAGRKAPS